jgi:hypothetical protein
LGHGTAHLLRVVCILTMDPVRWRSTEERGATEQNLRARRLAYEHNLFIGGDVGRPEWAAALLRERFGQPKFREFAAAPPEVQRLLDPAWVAKF